MVDLSICIVNWNVRDLLQQCLASIEMHRGALAIEVIVVDNASHDGAPEMVEQQFPWVRLIRNDRNENFSHANNQAARVSQGRHLLFLNNDTIVLPGSLQKLVGFLDNHPRAGMVGPRLIGRDGQTQRSYRPKPTVRAALHRLTCLRWTGLFRRAYQRYRRQPLQDTMTMSVEVLLGAAVAMPRCVYDAIGGWDEGYHFGLEDFDLSTRVSRSHEVYYHPDAEIIHLGRMSSRRNSGHVYLGVECGYARYLRLHVMGPLGGWLYKGLVVLNLPFSLLENGIRSVWKQWRHGPAPAGWPHSEWQGVCYFMFRGLPAFLKS